MSDRMELRYQRLLRAYPKAYRAHRGAEMITTLMDMAAAGRGAPTRGQALHLVLSGLRQRFRLPARRPLAWAGALVAAVVLGAFGATAGTWLGWQTAAPVPSDSELRELNAAISGMPAPAAVYREGSAMQGPDALVRAEGTAELSADRLRAALTAAGWRITSFQIRDGKAITSFGTDWGATTTPTRDLYYTAVKGGLKLQGTGSMMGEGADQGRAGPVSWATEVWPRETAVIRPLTVAGLVAGALAGWLAAAAFAAWVRASGPRRRRVATGAGVVAAALAAVPAYAHLRDAYQVMVYAHGSPYPYIVYSPGEEIPVVTWTVAGLVAVAAALVAAWPRHLDDGADREG
ncbi:hypothetical protein BJY16_006820 [Actinoplanes octamycinicus]|uniref:Uncharacterized protein n=1 Tax=Actinoplanes octamycinicus TaxID=135948 RepID=A0A7W7H3J9_9ACTN|nr:hypothetical protein [Actinoplanes octamycinicus]MBB4743361.1 hypothetical protein [Actinoplanes octamycinicus]GIE61877.1 hypothetical protein Aoc01nite_72790 [Actinoplanes octamycinicus]